VHFFCRISFILLGVEFKALNSTEIENRRRMQRKTSATAGSTGCRTTRTNTRLAAGPSRLYAAPLPAAHSRSFPSSSSLLSLQVLEGP